MLNHFVQKIHWNFQSPSRGACLSSHKAFHRHAGRAGEDRMGKRALGADNMGEQGSTVWCFCRFEENCFHTLHEWFPSMVKSTLPVWGFQVILSMFVPGVQKCFEHAPLSFTDSESTIFWSLSLSYCGFLSLSYGLWWDMVLSDRWIPSGELT